VSLNPLIGNIALHTYGFHGGYARQWVKREKEDLDTLSE
jgi:hypothetical protein